MNLYLDLGNTRLKWAAGDAVAWAHRGACPVADLPAALDAQWGGLPRPQAVWMAGAEPAGDAVIDWVASHWKLGVQRVAASREAAGVANGYLRPSELGADRWAALVAARALTDREYFVVDCGTAITVDAVDADSRFVGGAILPGLRMSRTALVRGTAGIETVGEEMEADGPMGCSTAAAVAGGTLWGLAGAVDRLLEAAGRVPEGAPVFITGGDALHFQALLRHHVTVVPDLVLQGIARLAEAGR